MTKEEAAKPTPRQRLLAAADELFYRDGIHTVGIDRVIEKAGVAKGSLYYNFGSKDDLVREYLLGRHAAWSAQIDSTIAKVEDPAEKVLAVFDALAVLFTQPDYRGCSFVNAAAEAQPGGPELAAAADFRAWLHALFAELVQALKVEEPDRVVDQLVILYDGAVTAAQMDSSPRPAATARGLAAMVLNTVS